MFARLESQAADCLSKTDRFTQVPRPPWYADRLMRSLRFLPLVFLVGIDGFVMFAPYVVALLSTAYAVRRLKPAPLFQLISLPAR